ncbi:hypothetical protein HHI36_002953 [Cryptolaemus montrouzieri]|uniref:Cystatin domain-containing protein n=1 Tax=Cryptolaemus montrouzieri TaxID=559131 RepID=A0ABD2PCJ0_9CUCU
MNSRIITINCGGSKISFNALEPLYRSKRSLLGGWSPSPIVNPKIIHHLKKLLTKLDSQSGKDNKLKVKEIISASSQVVAGTNWDIKAKIALSDCSKSDEKLIENCGDDKDKFETICEFKFWEKLPDKNGVRELDNVQINCEDPKLNVRSKREVHDTLVGGHNAVSNDDPRIIEHLNKLLPKLDSQSDKEHKFKIEKILSATSQVVAGTNWNIKAVVVLSDCLKSEEKNR